MTSPGPVLAVRYYCQHHDSPSAGWHHDSGNGHPPRQKCRGCGGQLRTVSGLWGVFEWTGTGRYPAEAARELRLSGTIAQKHADIGNSDEPGANLVVRWVPEESLACGHCGCDVTATAAER